MKLNPHDENVQLHVKNFTNVTFLHTYQVEVGDGGGTTKNLRNARAPTTNDLLIMNQ